MEGKVKDRLNEKEYFLFELIQRNDDTGVRTHMVHCNINPNICDDNGMSPLALVAYKGNYNLCQFLIDRGADPNSIKHEHDYTPLHFAALSGKPEVCRLLLEAGANSQALNSVGRTASETAAFVGNHYCVAVINNWIPRADVEYFTQRRGTETEPKLPPVLSNPFYFLVTRVNIHPVRVALNFQPVLIKHLSTIKNVLELMSEREMKRGANTNEILAFKLHYLSFIAGEVKKYQVHEKEKDAVEMFIRILLRSGRGEDYMDQMIRECVREFPHRKSTLFLQMVTSLAKNNGSFEAYSVLKQALMGTYALIDNIKFCATCEEERDIFKKCSKCKQVFYCDRECQRLHWFIHKKECDRKSKDILTTTKRENKLKEGINREESANKEKEISQKDNQDNEPAENEEQGLIGESVKKDEDEIYKDSEASNNDTDNDILRRTSSLVLDTKDTDIVHV